MGDLAGLTGKAVYLDTNVFVYAVEGFAPHRAFVEGLFRAVDAGRLRAVTSELTLAEVLVKPLELGRTDIAELYTDLVQDSGRLTVVPIDRTILMEAARYRVELGLRLPDAIHVATAVAAGCDALLSNDQGLKVPAGLRLVRPA